MTGVQTCALPIFKANTELLKADVILISDTAMISMDTPSIDIGVRGLSYIELEVTGPNRDLHSGVYGGSVANPITILSKMIASCHDENNHITIPGFYDDVIASTDAERKKMAGAYKKSSFTSAQQRQPVEMAQSAVMSPVQRAFPYTSMDKTVRIKIDDKHSSADLSIQTARMFGNSYVSGKNP